jgi:protein-tyrosine phosphatase
MAHILLVCTANICRSPLAEALLRQRLQRQGYTDWHISSAGTWAQVARGASQFSHEVLQEQEALDLSTHRARMVTEAMLAEQDLVLCMESGHAEALRAEFPQHALKIYMISQMSHNRRFNISDPYGGPKEGYEMMLSQVRELIDAGLPRIIELAEQGAKQRTTAVSANLSANLSTNL